MEKKITSIWQAAQENNQFRNPELDKLIITEGFRFQKELQAKIDSLGPPPFGYKFAWSYVENNPRSFNDIMEMFENPKIEVNIYLQKLPKPIRIQRLRTKGFKLQAQSPDGRPVVSVCRPGKWGNPFWIEKHKDRCVVYFQDSISPSGIGTTKKDAAQLAKDWFVHDIKNNKKFIAEIKAELKGKHLACFCPLDSPCHADVLLKIANEE